MIKRDFEKENEKIFKWIFGVSSFVIFLLFLTNEPWRQRGCYLNEYYIYESEFKGEVIEKFVDYPNHATESIVFNSKVKIGLLGGDYYSKIEIGDSVHKIKNSFDLKIKRKDSIVTMPYKLLCEEEGYLKY